MPTQDPETAGANVLEVRRLTCDGHRAAHALKTPMTPAFFPSPRENNGGSEDASIDAAVRRFLLDPIIGAGGVWRDKAVLEIGGDRGGIATAWIAEAAAAWRVEEEALTSGDFLQALAFELLARGLEAEISGPARAPAVPPARREFGAVEGSEDLDRAGRSVLDLQL
jgi:hypothetical protein